MDKAHQVIYLAGDYVEVLTQLSQTDRLQVPHFNQKATEYHTSDILALQLLFLASNKWLYQFESIVEVLGLDPLSLVRCINSIEGFY